MNSFFFPSSGNDKGRDKYFPDVDLPNKRSSTERDADKLHGDGVTQKVSIATPEESASAPEAGKFDEVQGGIAESRLSSQQEALQVAAVTAARQKSFQFGELSTSVAKRQPLATSSSEQQPPRKKARSVFWDGN
jgi:hypothetical protein